VVSLFASLGRLDGLVVEITEHREISDVEGFDRALDRFRTAGARIAVDDAGAGHAGLAQILWMRPGILKLDRSLVEDIDHDEAKSAMVEMLGLFASRVDAWLLAEGVETVGEARRIEQLGVPLAQGYLYARPAPAWAEISPDAVAAMRQNEVRRSDGGLRQLLSPVPTISGDQVAAAAAMVAESSDRIVVVVDDGRPVGVLTPDSALARTLVEGLRANVNTTPAELAHRLGTRTALDTSTPVLVTDDRGRYVGVVTVARLLIHLAGGGGSTPTDVTPER
jgi:CBS domain-containing protein